MIKEKEILIAVKVPADFTPEDETFAVSYCKTGDWGDDSESCKWRVAELEAGSGEAVVGVPRELLIRTDSALADAHGEIHCNGAYCDVASLEADAISDNIESVSLELRALLSTKG